MGAASNSDSSGGAAVARDFGRLRAAAHGLLFKGGAAKLADVGRYRILRRLGSGGMGVVYAAHDPDLDREVAVKVLQARSVIGSDGDAIKKRWIREARSLAKLAHPNVVHVYEVGTLDDTDEVYIAMERVAGRTLRDFRVDCGESVDAVLEVYLQAAKGLAAAHEAGLVHRDFKPDNVLVGDDGRARVLDFGLARSLSEGEATSHGETEELARDGRVTKDGTIMGTPAYMAPEQRAGKPVDARSDQYSYCVALFEALYGRRPVGGHASTDNLSDGGAALPVLRRGLAMDPTARWPTMDQLIDALTAARRAPARRRNAALLSVGALGLVGLVLAARSVGQDDPVSAQCAAASASMDAAWNEARADALASSIESKAPEIAEPSMVAVRTAFERHTTRWHAVHSAVCSADGPTAERFAVLQCLQSNADSLGATATALLDADRTRLTLLSEALTLPSPDDCASTERRRAVMPMPEDETSRAQVQALRLAVRGAELSIRLGEPRAALATLATLDDDVTELAFAPLTAEVEFARAGALGSAGEIDGAREASEKAVALAKRGGYPQLEAQAWASLAALIGYYQRNADEGHRCLAMAAAALEQAGGDADLEVKILGSRGQIHLGAGELDQARVAFEGALALAELNDVALTLRAQLRFNIGVVLRQQGKFDDAHRFLTEALASQIDARGEAHPETVGTSVSLANIDIASGRPEAAVPALLRAKALLGGQDHETAKHLLNSLSQAYAKLGRHHEAAAVLREAIEVHERSQSPGIDHARVLSNLADSQSELADNDAAAKTIEAALTMAEKAVGTGHPDLTRIVLKRAKIYAALGQTERARSDVARARALASEHGQLPALRDGLDTLERELGTAPAP